MAAPGCCTGSVVRCSCSCLPACRVLYRTVSRGLGGWRVGVAVRCLAVRVARLVLSCWDALSGVAGWVRCNTPVLAGRSWRVRGSRVAGLWSLACPLWGSRGKEYWPVSKAPSRSLTLLTFWAAGDVSLAPFSKVTCAESAPASHAFPGEGARRSRQRTYPLILALEGNILDDCLIIFPWSSARPWVQPVWLAPWPGPLWVRFAGGEGWVEGQVRVGRHPFLCRGRVAGVWEAWPPPGGCGRNSLGFCSCLTPWAAKASPYSLPVCCTCRTGRRLSRRRARPTGVGGVGCAVALCRVVRGGPFGQGRLARGPRG